MSLASRVLPITRRGQFFEDDFFRDFQQDYSTAVHDVLDRFGGRSLLADQFTNYRKALQSETRVAEDDVNAGLAASISDTPENYVIVLDMTDYVGGEITVRTSGCNAVVDAKVGKDKKFHRVYPLPKNTNTDAVTAAMSDEGILTISAKRRKRESVMTVEATTSIDEPCTAAKNLPNYVSILKVDVGQSEEAPSSPTAASPSVSTSTTHESSQTDTSCSGAYKTLPISRRGQFFKDAFFENVWKDFDTAMEDMITRQKQRQEKKQEERQKREEARREVLNKMVEEEEEQRRKLQAERLERHRKASQDMQEQLKLIHSPLMDRFTSYRTLRSWAGGEDSQAATITADNKSYKVVMDVKDFADGQLDLKSDGDVLTVSGSKAGTTFKREFSLPGLDSPELVTASMSEDGVLTVTAPKKQ